MFKKLLNKTKRNQWPGIEQEYYLLHSHNNNNNINDRETLIVFVYDTECLKEESDDPVSAVLYFHPSWVSDTQKVALCGQLMGTSFFLKHCFFKPRIISLQNGKFIFRQFGRLLLAVGTDRNIADNLLERRADLLTSLIKFYQRDLQLIYQQPQQKQQQAHEEKVEEAEFLSIEKQKNVKFNKNYCEKLYQVLETYLPILQCSGNVYHNVPKLRLPKTASNIYLEAIQTLQSCQQTKGILGGAILYHNKIVATQLGDMITKQLVLSDPLHVRSMGEQIHVGDFHVPNGVQMLIVYVDVKQYQKLSTDAKRAQTLQSTQLAQSVLPFQYGKRKMKRDKSLIFTNIPEECGVESSSGKDSSSDEAAVDCCASLNAIESEENQLPLQRPKTLLIRPTHLPLRSKNNARDLPESGIASINFDETDSYPEFIGRTSVCSTPMTENKVLQVGNIMSICANVDETDNVNGSHNSVHTKLMQRGNSLKLDIEKFLQQFLHNSSTKQPERRSSLTNIQDSLKRINKKLTLNAKLDKVTDFIENEEDEDEDSSSISDAQSHTITDPTCPILDANGQPISSSLWQEIMSKYHKLCADATDNKQKEELTQLAKQFKEFESELQQLELSLSKASRQIINSNENSNMNFQKLEFDVKTPLDKKSLSLPLKPLSENSNYNRQQTGNIPLTPLMAKLSVLALNDERNLGTPAVELQTPIYGNKIFNKRNSLKCEDAVDALKMQENPGDGLQLVELYMCEQQNMTLLLLMEEGSALQQRIVQCMFDICVAKFPHMEAQLNQTLNINMEGEQSDSDYSLLTIDAKWDAVQRHGPWNIFELNMLECMNKDFRSKKDITNLILRSQDSVFYGQKSGRSEFYYKESVNQVAGVPPPSDLMGNVTLRAKMRLERDHSYILF